MNGLTELEMRADTEARHSHRELVEVYAARIEELEAKLAKAVAALYAISGRVPFADDPYDIARATLTELKGKSDE